MTVTKNLSEEYNTGNKVSKNIDIKTEVTPILLHKIPTVFWNSAEFYLTGTFEAT